MNNNAQRLETVTLYAEEHQYGTDQLHTLIALMGLLKSSQSDDLDHGSITRLAEHAGDLLQIALESLTNTIQK